MPKVRLIRGDATQPWPVEDNSLDSIVTDPPYGIAFMGKAWDDKGGPEAYQAWTTTWAKEAYRTLKPGGFLLAFGATRMAHRMACGFEDAGFRIVDTIEWLYLTGFPKAQDIGKMFDKQAGVERQVIGTTRAGIGRHGRSDYEVFRGTCDEVKKHIPVTAPATPRAKKWDGWKTPNLKPAHEPIIMAQKPFSGTYIDNIERWGVGAINVDGCRIPHTPENEGNWGGRNKSRSRSVYGTFADEDGETPCSTRHPLGRFPANVVTLDEDEWYSPYFNITPRELSKKASSSEKKGDGWKNTHPTVKPVDLVRWLQRLVTPPGGTTASPFLGSGTDAVAAILEGFDFFGMDVSDEYWPIVEARLNELSKSVEFERVPA